jgi:murein DD-endopeptidase MepM/ murein hydrolase activator NlpD
MTVALVVGVVAVGSSTIAARPSPVVGAVAGVVATPEPTPTDPSAATESATAEPVEGAVGVAAASPVIGARMPADDDEIDVVPKLRHGPDPATLTGYQWPLPNGRLTLPFGPSPWGSRIVDGENFHDGIDLATFCGDRVVAAHDGVVVAAGRHFDTEIGWVGDLGPYLRRLERKHLWTTLPIAVVVDDGNGYRSIYAHFGKIVVKKGEAVRAGQLIGYEGATGRASGCHLHYGLFSPQESLRFRIDKDVAKRMKLPREQVARIDPRLVLPARTKAPKPTPSTAP